MWKKPLISPLGLLKTRKRIINDIQMMIRSPFETGTDIVPVSFDVIGNVLVLA